MAVISYIAAGSSDLKYLQSAIWRSRNAQPPDRSPEFDRLIYHYDGLATFMQMLGAQLPITITLHPQSLKPQTQNPKPKTQNPNPKA